ncbi:MAG: type II toxin-antitoxin system HigB family toxin [Bacteroidota bacterium]
MKVHLVKEKTIEDFVMKHASCETSFQEWMMKIKYADWDNPQDMKSTFNSVDILGKGSSRAVFDIGGNNFRLIGKYGFGRSMVHLFICWIGTHKAYDELCKSNMQYTVNDY